jgi:hypothetical protein
MEIVFPKVSAKALKPLSTTFKGLELRMVLQPPASHHHFKWYGF